MKIRLATLFILLTLILAVPMQTSAQAKPGLLLPIGAGYTDTYAGLGQHAVANARGDVVHILVLATPYATDAQHISTGEFAQNMKDAEERRLQTDGACQRSLPEGSTLTCKVELLPIFTQEDALKPENLAYFTDDVSLIFILGGDQETGMGAILGTPIEERINELHAMGTIIAGTSAGAAMQSKIMIASLSTNYGINDSLRVGAVRYWNTEEQHGLSFGLQNAVLDQHFFQRARMGRLLNVITQPGMPHLGVGVDAYTGVVSDSEVLRDVFGLYTVTVLDAETYHSADAVKYVTVEANRPPIISIRNVVVNLLSPGDVTYDLNTRSSSIANPPAVWERSFETLTIPQGAGPLLLGGDILETVADSPILKQFKELAGDNILIVASGYPSGRSAETAIKKYTDGLGVTVQSIVVGDAPIVIPADVTGVLVIGKDQSKVKTASLAPLKDFWLSGKPVMADNAVTPILGAFYSNHEPTPSDSELEELAIQKSFWQGRTKMLPGLGWLNVTLEPQLIGDLRFGRLFSLAYNHPDLLSIGLNQNTAILLTADGATALGSDGVYVFDLRKAVTQLGTNEGFIISNAMLDVFVPGDVIQPEVADVNAQFDPAPTPLLPTPAPTATQTPPATPIPPATPTQPAPTATSAPAETPAPAAEPEAALPIWVMVIAAGAAIVAALWYSRKRR
ncbi:MAG: cyanophycinase [Chloroflexi bacterium]|nr:cyanophycinase [Chloroflexota bacterium]